MNQNSAIKIELTTRILRKIQFFIKNVFVIPIYNLSISLR